MGIFRVFCVITSCHLQIGKVTSSSPTYMPLSHFLAQLLWLVFSVLCWINVVRLDILIFLLTLQNDDNNNNNNNNSSNNNNNKTLSVSWLSMMLAFEYDSGFLFPSVLCSLSLSFPSGIPYGKCCYV